MQRFHMVQIFHMPGKIQPVAFLHHCKKAFFLFFLLKAIFTLEFLQPELTFFFCSEMVEADPNQADPALFHT